MSEHPGKPVGAASTDQKTITLQVLRYRPEQESEPVWQRYTVPYTDDMSVLQALQWIKDEEDGSLAFRWSCRMAICGSCGKPRPSSRRSSARRNRAVAITRHLKTTTCSCKVCRATRAGWAISATRTTLRTKRN